MDTVTASDITTSSVRVAWSHSCMQCSSWEICRKKVGIFGGVLSLYSCSTQSLGNSQTGSDLLVNSLDSGKTYRFRIKGQAGNICTGSVIGKVDATIN